MTPSGVNAAIAASEPHQLPLASGKPATLGVTHVASQPHGFVKIHSHLPRLVGVGTERDRDAFLPGEPENLRGRIDLPAILAQPGGVQFDRAMVFARGLQKSLVKRRAVACRAMPEFLRQIGVAENFEAAGFRRAGQPLEIGRPNLPDVATVPFRQRGGMVDSPGIGDNGPSR